MSKKITATSSLFIVDGEQKEPNKNYKALLEDPDCPQPSSLYTYYELQVGDFLMKFYLSYTSRVEIDYEKIEGLLETWPNRFTNRVAIVKVLHATVINCAFAGSVQIAGTTVEECILSDSFITNSITSYVLNESQKYTGHVINNSTIDNSQLTPNGTFESVVLRNVDICMRTPYTAMDEVLEYMGLPHDFNYPPNSFTSYQIYESSLINTQIRGYGKTMIAHSYLCDSGLDFHGYLKLAGVRLSDVHIDAPSIRVTGPLSFFTIALPFQTVHVFETKDIGMVLAVSIRSDIDGPCFIVDRDDFVDKLTEYLSAFYDKDLSSIMDLINDSIKSRAKVLECEKELGNISQLTVTG